MTSLEEVVSACAASVIAGLYTSLGCRASRKVAVDASTRSPEPGSPCSAHIQVDFWT